jgi:threonyl-tRNA synthetase
MYMTTTPDERTFAIKPMNCPGHIQLFKQGLRSYRELPLRLAEFGKVHRYEPSGALHGLMRVRAFTQDDAHIFCTPEQITDEAVKVTELILSIYRDFGFNDVRIKFSDRPPKRVGSDESWDIYEAALKQAAAAAGIETTLNAGEGAFYGPKLEFVLRDAIGRDWQCGTLQVDPESARKARRELYRRRQPEAHARDAAPGDVRLVGAIYRDFARTPCRQTADLAVARAGGNHGNYRQTGGILHRNCGKPEKSGASGRNGLEE